jgi:dTDP-4-amino-4,6-dideoxygalactose transaminase
VGSSFLPSEIIAAFLWAQLENLEDIQNKRKKIWLNYYEQLDSMIAKNKISLPFVPDYASNNAHMFYLICKDLEQRTEFIDRLKAKNILAVFHYISLHSSPYYENKHDGRILFETNRYTDCILRLPMYYELSEMNQQLIIEVLSNEK